MVVSIKVKNQQKTSRKHNAVSADITQSVDYKNIKPAENQQKTSKKSFQKLAIMG